jgi:ParB/RepB/Spo0J family partition protein
MKTQKRKIAGLKEHPRQHEFFSDATDAELDELAADMDQRGQQDPVRILPDDRIVEGHQRLRAARKLGWEEIDVIVCHELAEAGEDAILYALISDNVNRRQVDDLTRARCYEELRVIEKKEILEGRRKVRSGDSRDRLAERLGAGISGRQLDRLRQLLLLPRPIQDAISRREMPQSLGHKILKIEPEKQDEIAQRLVLKDTVDQIITQFDLKSERRQPSRGL